MPTRAPSHEIVAGMIARPRQRRCGDLQEAFGARNRAIGRKSLRSNEFGDLGMLGRRLEILAHRQEIDPGGPHIVHHLMDLQPLLAQPDHHTRLGKDRGVELLDLFQQTQRRIITRTRPDRRVEPRHGFEIVIIDVGPRRDDRLDGAVRFVAKIRCQDFDRSRRRGPAQRLDHLDELAGAAILEIVAIDRGDDNVRQPEFGGGVRDMLRLGQIDGARHAGLDVAERAGARARIAQNHHGCVLLGPAFADIRASRFLAHRREVQAAHQLTRLVKTVTGRRLDTDPVGLAFARRADRQRLVHVRQIASVRAPRHPHPACIRRSEACAARA